MGRSRHQVRFELSPEAHDGMRRFARAHGTTVTGLLEVLGRSMDSQAETPLDELAPSIREIVLAARVTDASRRRRRRGEPTPP